MSIDNNNRKIKKNNVFFVIIKKRVRFLIHTLLNYYKSSNLRCLVRKSNSFFTELSVGKLKIMFYFCRAKLGRGREKFFAKLKIMLRNEKFWAEVKRDR